MRWEIFTQEEKEMIEDLTKRGEFAAIVKCVAVDSPEKEYQLNEYLEEVRPEEVHGDSKVLKEMLEAKARGEDIDSPEKEAEWQKKLDEEKKEMKAKAKKKATKKEEDSTKK